MVFATLLKRWLSFQFMAVVATMNTVIVITLGICSAGVDVEEEINVRGLSRAIYSR
jgi:hypothetical protein